MVINKKQTDTLSCATIEATNRREGGSEIKGNEGERARSRLGKKWQKGEGSRGGMYTVWQFIKGSCTE